MAMSQEYVFSLCFSGTLWPDFIQIRWIEFHKHANRQTVTFVYSEHTNCWVRCYESQWFHSHGDIYPIQANFHNLTLSAKHSILPISVHLRHIFQAPLPLSYTLLLFPPLLTFGSDELNGFRGPCFMDFVQLLRSLLRTETRALEMSIQTACVKLCVTSFWSENHIGT